MDETVSMLHEVGQIIQNIYKIYKEGLSVEYPKAVKDVVFLGENNEKQYLRGEVNLYIEDLLAARETLDGEGTLAKMLNGRAIPHKSAIEFVSNAVKKYGANEEALRREYFNLIAQAASEGKIDEETTNKLMSLIK